MSTYTPPAPEDIFASAQDVADEANTHDSYPTLFGKELHPFDSQRYSAAQKMGLRMGQLNPVEFAEFETSGTYPSLFGDTVVVCFLCSSPKSTVIRALRLPDEALEKAYAWADEVGIGADMDKTATAAEFFGKTISNLYRVKGDLKNLNSAPSSPVETKN